MGNLLNQSDKINQSIDFLNESIDIIINEQDILDKLNALQSDIESRASRFTSGDVGGYNSNKNSVAQQIYDSGYSELTINFSNDLQIIKDSSGDKMTLSQGNKTFKIVSYGGGETIKVTSNRSSFLISFKHKKENSMNGGEISVYNERDKANYSPSDWSGEITNFKK